jgi:predicted RNA methylase
MAVSFSSTAGRSYTTQTITVSALTPSTAYIAYVGHPTGHSQTIEFTTDGAGAATLSFVPQAVGAHNVTVVPKTAAAVATGSNNFKGA